MATTKSTIEEMKNEIREKVQKNIVPKSVKSFKELNKYIDAYELGGFCNTMSVYWPSPKFKSECFDGIDKWIKSGGLNG